MVKEVKNGSSNEYSNYKKKNKNKNYNYQKKSEEKDFKEAKYEEKIEKAELKREQEDFLDEKVSSGIGKKMFDIAFWVIIIFLFIVWIIDFTRFKNEKEPKFCISNKEYADKSKSGKIYECTGLGYKIYRHTVDEETDYRFDTLFSKYEEK